VPTFLTLSPDTGGPCFGPFEGDISIGTDPRSQVLLDTRTGALAVHARITSRPGGWVLHPGAAGAPLFVTRRAARSAPVSGPVHLSAGDRITLVTRDGPTFEIGPSPARSGVAAGPTASAAPSPGPRSAARPYSPAPPSQPAPPRPRSGPRRGPPTAGELATEARRQAEVELMRMGPMQQLRQFMFRWNAGTLMQPRYIVGALFGLFGTGFVTCTGIAGAIWAWVQQRG
jgi:hypothetical protein